MKTSKRLTNTTGLKIAFIPATNTQSDKFKITQTNCKKSITISGNIDADIVSFVSGVLDGVEAVKSYSLVVDNTQSKYYLFSLDFVADSFENILNNFKKF